MLATWTPRPLATWTPVPALSEVSAGVVPLAPGALLDLVLSNNPVARKQLYRPTIVRRLHGALASAPAASAPAATPHALQFLT